MRTRVNLMVFVAVTVLASACAQHAAHWVRLGDLNEVHFVDADLTKAQITKAVIEGAEAAGWRVKDLGNDTVRAVYIVRVHTVQIEIDVSDRVYMTRYVSSNNMKSFCSEADKRRLRNMKITGQQGCPNQSDPLYIHYGYKQWMDSLNASIRQSLATAS